VEAYFTVLSNKHVLCLSCLAKKPDAAFGQRLKAFRLAAGLTQKQLSMRSGVPDGIIGGLEQRAHRSPGWTHLVALMKVLGAGLVTLGLEGTPTNQQR
jgi:transcriptional regulator with XRE-family HTH domain